VYCRVVKRVLQDRSIALFSTSRYYGYNPI
jgi:hypothetical protein